MHKPNRSFAKKVFAAGLAVSTALWTAGALLVLPVAAVEAHPAGTLVLSGGTVWHISDDGTGRHGFDSAEKFYSQRFEFADVVPANSADLALPDLGLMPWGSGVLFNDGGTVYQVAGGMKHGFTSAANFTGNGFSFSDVMAGNLSGLTAGATISNTTAAHMEGTFVVSSGTVWMVTATGRKGVTSPGVLYSHGVDFGDVVPANAADLALANEGNTTFRTGALVNDGGTLWAVTSTTKRGFPTASCYTGFGFNFSMPVSGSTAGLTVGANYCAESVTPTPTPTPSTSTGVLTMSLASDTPAAGIAVENAARVGFTKVNFTATGGDVTIDSMTVERTGVAQDAAFADIILLDVSNSTSVAMSNQIGNEKSLSSDHKSVFGDDITVKNGTTKSILVAANMGATLNAGQTAYLGVVAVQVLGSATSSGSLPLTGNGQTFEGNVAIGTVTVANGGQNPAASTQNVGVVDYVVSSIKITAGGQEDIEISKIRFYQNGTAADGDVKNLELMVDGSVVGTVAAVVNKGADFVFTPPIVITKGNNKDFNLRLDLVDGSSRTVSFDVDKKTDIVAKGKTFGYFRVPTYDNTTSPFYNANNTTIDVGTISFSKGVLPTLNVAEGSSNQPIGALKVTVQGEPIRVTQLVLGVSIAGGGDTTDVTDITVKDATGAVVAGPVDPDTTVAARDTATSTDTIIFPVGTNTYTVYGKLSSDFSDGSTIIVDLPDPDTLITAKGNVTNQTITANPTSDLSLDTVTVRTATLLVSTSSSPASQSVIIGAANFTFSNFILNASNSGEDIRVSSLALAHKTDDDTTREDQIANLQLYNGSTALAPIVQPTNRASATTATTTITFTSPVVITKGGSVTLTLKGDIVNGAAADLHQWACLGSACVTATGASTGNTVTATVTNTASDGATMTLATSGTFTLSSDASSPTQGALLTGGVSKATAGVLLFTAQNEDVDLTTLHFQTVNAVNQGDLLDEYAMVYLFDGDTQIASQAPTTTDRVTFTGLDGKLRMTKGVGKKLTVKVDSAAVTNQQGDGNTADAGDGVSFDVAQDAYSGKGVSSGTKVTDGNMSGTFTGQQFTVYKSVPTWSKVALSSNTLTNSSGLPLFRFKLTADAKGDIGFYRASFAITTTTATITAFELIEEPGTTNQVNLTNNATRDVSTQLIASSDGKGGQNQISILFDTGTDGVANGGEFRFVSAGASKTFELRGTVANSTTGSSASIVFMSDNAFSGTNTDPRCAGFTSAMAGNNTCTGIAQQEQGKFVWSDLAWGNSSTTATDTVEWFNGFRVPGLTTTSSAEVLSK